jgi:hypothetical protein
MKPRRITLYVLAVLGTLTVAILPTAAQEQTLSTKELTKRADLVVIGRVARVHSDWTNDRSRIVTTVTVAVEQQLKGEGTSGTVDIVTPGGEVDGTGEWYSHSARFQKDENVVLFAERASKGGYRVTGGNQGKLSISEDQQTSVARVSQLMTLDDLKKEISNAVQQHAEEQ